MSLSVAIATHNEEDNISRCIESVYNWVDEIVIVDGESSDKTIEVLKSIDKEKKIHIFREKNPPMFHINKQKAIERCKRDWILQLDADEVVSDELKEEMENVILTTKGRRNPDKISRFARNDNQYVAYWIPRLNYFLGKPLLKGGQYPDMTIRLYKNGVAHFPCKDVHEQVDIKGHVGKLQKDLLHFPYPTFKSYLDKLVRYSKLEAAIWKEQGIKPSLVNSVKYMIILPIWWFLKTYFRHRGYVDGIPGLVFSFFSATRYCIAYVNLLKLAQSR